MRDIWDTWSLRACGSGGQGRAHNSYATVAFALLVGAARSHSPASEATHTHSPAARSHSQAGRPDSPAGHPDV